MSAHAVTWGGAPLGLLVGRGASLEREMTIVVALAGTDEVVLAADTLANSGENSGYYKFGGVRKLVPVKDKGWVLGYAGTAIGCDLHSLIEKEPGTFSDDIEVGAHEYARRMRQLYEEHGYTGEAYLLMGGVRGGEAFVYGWNFGTDRDGGAHFDGAKRQPHRTAIGASHHGAMYFANAFHSVGMDTRQRVLLAYFCVQEAAKYDPRVGGPIEVAVVHENEVKFLGPTDLSDVESRSAEIAGDLHERFNAPGPRVPGF